MAERDYRVTYKSREVDPREESRFENPRGRIPSALDPYLYPDDRDELKRNAALAKVRASTRYETDDYRDYESTIRRDTIRDDGTTTTVRDAGRPATTKTTYSVTSAGLEKESEVKSRAPTRARDTVVSTSSPPVSRRTEYRERDNDYEVERVSTVPARSLGRAPTRTFDDRDYSRVDRSYEIERPRPENGVYIIDARDAEVYVGGSRDYGRGPSEYRNSTYDDEYRSSQSRAAPSRVSEVRRDDTRYSSYGDYRSSAPSVNSGTPYMSGAKLERVPTASKSQGNLRGPSRQSTMMFEDDRGTSIANQNGSRMSTRREEDDFTFVERRDTRAPTIRENFKDPFHDDPPPPETPRGRTRASTFTMSPSEDGYVMVSPPQQRAPTNVASTAGGDNLRSSLVKSRGYSEEDRQRRRRSQSLSFRAHEAENHYAGDRYHQPPGEEAAACGKFLKHYGGQRSVGGLGYTSQNSSRRDDRELEIRSRSSKREEVDYDQRDREVVRYTPQEKRSKSRRRRGSDDESYVSKYLEKTKKTTYY